jgi:hypothetical protein
VNRDLRKGVARYASTKRRYFDNAIDSPDRGVASLILGVGQEAASALQVFVMTAASGKGHDDVSVVRRYAKIAGVEVNAGAGQSAL